MELPTILLQMLALISGACRDPEKLPGALISCGVVEAAMALCLILSKAPGGLFLHHGKALYYLYYGILIAILIFGLLEASAGFWVSGDVVGRRAAGKTILWVSILPLVIVVALGGFVILKT
ncbi:uncharacterized protein LOC104581427 [Brachypodium distachyon]|uniref:Uncharacterized protein n=1 Tax=Brachypodium distachyon TaxID=15368 RepID=A0A0Q3KWY4_BRADI|nr:uncharacterized protein LOC104581427 [Brachypodium distachyon]KQJ84669.1 hypothetical protein BRADI_5g22154v3 [Brachypodium distachyon]|eukprot:XP_010227272.1 uncharacterized protein LOC104581427 [Brachypodium distachyon]